MVFISDAGARRSEVREKTSEPLWGFHSKAKVTTHSDVLWALVVLRLAWARLEGTRLCSVCRGWAGVAVLDAEAVEAGLTGVEILLPPG